MPPRKRAMDPLGGHWTATLNRIYDIDNGRAFVCLLCVRQGKTRERSTVKATHNASNVYSHIKLQHNSIHTLIDPIIRARDKNKHVTVCGTIEGSLEKSKV